MGSFVAIAAHLKPNGGSSRAICTRKDLCAVYETGGNKRNRGGNVEEGEKRSRTEKQSTERRGKTDTRAEKPGGERKG